MKLVDKPYFSPGHCVVCRSGNRKQFIDPQVAFDYEGHVYICDKCVVEMANLLFYTPKIKIPDGFQGLVEEASRTITTAAEELNDRLSAGLLNLSAIATSLTNMAESQKQFVEQRTSELASEPELSREETPQTPGPGGERSLEGKPKFLSKVGSGQKLGTGSKPSADDFKL